MLGTDFNVKFFVAHSLAGSLEEWRLQPELGAVSFEAAFVVCLELTLIEHALFYGDRKSHRGSSAVGKPGCRDYRGGILLLC